MAKETLGIEQAFASIAVEGDRTYGDTGLTKREYFAAIALKGILSRDYKPTCNGAATWAVECADALIYALNK